LDEPTLWAATREKFKLQDDETALVGIALILQSEGCNSNKNTNIDMELSPFRGLLWIEIRIQNSCWIYPISLVAMCTSFWRARYIVRCKFGSEGEFEEQSLNSTIV